MEASAAGPQFSALAAWGTQGCSRFQVLGPASVKLGSRTHTHTHTHSHIHTHTFGLPLTHMHTCMHTHIHTHLHACARKPLIHTSTHIYTLTVTHSHSHTDPHICTPTPTHKHIGTHTHTFTHIYMPTFTHVHTQTTHIHTHICTLSHAVHTHTRAHINHSHSLLHAHTPSQTSILSQDEDKVIKIRRRFGGWVLVLYDLPNLYFDHSFIHPGESQFVKPKLIQIVKRFTTESLYPRKQYLPIISLPLSSVCLDADVLFAENLEPQKALKPWEPPHRPCHRKPSFENFFHACLLVLQTLLQHLPCQQDRGSEAPGLLRYGSQHEERPLFATSHQTHSTKTSSEQLSAPSSEET